MQSHHELIPSGDADAKEGLRLVQAADRHLAESRFTEAAQLFAQAEPLLVASDRVTSKAIAGCRHLAQALSSYFADKTESAITAVRAARLRFSASKHKTHMQFCIALEHTFMALLGSEGDDHALACANLERAVQMLDSIETSSSLFAGSCAFWRDWASVCVYGSELCNKVANLDPEAAERLLASIGTHLSALVERAAAPLAREYFSLIGDLYASIVQLAQALSAAEARAHTVAIRLFNTILPTLRTACTRIASLDIPEHVRHMNESFLFLEALAESEAHLTASEASVFAGDRVKAMEHAHSAILLLKDRRSRFTPSIRGGAGYDVDIDDLISNARRDLARVRRGDPGMLALASDMAKIVPADALDVTTLQVRELTNAFMSRLWMSSIVLAGGLMELFLGASIEKHRQAHGGQRCQASVKPSDSLRLVDLITEAESVGLLRKGVVHLSHGLREFRNLIHPAKRSREASEPTESEARAACDVLRLIIRDLARS